MMENLVSKAKCLKMIGKKNYVVQLMESESGSYYIVTEQDEKKDFSPAIQDLNTAMSVFDTVVQQFEGN
jgi:hypothetical protein